MNNKLMIIAGEASGDMHGAGLISELRKLRPDLKIFGIGGDKMIAEGMHALFHIKQMAFLGFIEVIRHLPFISKVKNVLLDTVEREKIETIILIDYPGFNLNIAKKLKASGKQIIYYISPQIWAWGKGRINKIKKLVDQMIVVFPFEEKLYKENGIPVEYVGHPLIERIKYYNFISKDELFAKFGLERQKEILLILPGSRKHEIKKIFPVTIKAALKLAGDFNLQVVVACAENIDPVIFSLTTPEKNYKIIKGYTYDLYKYAKFGIIKSGTSTLEAGIIGLPFIVVYSTNFLTYEIGKRVVEIDNIAMANILLGENAVDELIQHDVNEKNIYNRCAFYLGSENEIDKMKIQLAKIEIELGGPGASAKAAATVIKKMNETER